MSGERVFPLDMPLGHRLGRRILRIARIGRARFRQVLPALGPEPAALVERCRLAFVAARRAYRQAQAETLAAAHRAEALEQADLPFDPKLASFYANLEVPYGSDLGAVARSWKELVKKYHPDLHAGDPERQALANQVVQGLNRAYQELERGLARISARSVAAQRAARS